MLPPAMCAMISMPTLGGMIAPITEDAAVTAAAVPRQHL
jgi:hypothetical protein